MERALDPHAPAASGADDDASLQVEGVIPVIAETLHVDRRTLEGAVRVTKRVHAQPVELDETAHEERISVRRVPIGRPVDGPVGVRQDGDVTIVPVLEERLVAEKRLVLVEELHLIRERTTHRRPQRVVLQREELVVERLDPRTGTWSVLDAPIAPDPATTAAPPAARPEQPAVDTAGLDTAPNATR